MIIPFSIICTGLHAIHEHRPKEKNIKLMNICQVQAWSLGRKKKINLCYFCYSWRMRWQRNTICTCQKAAMFAVILGWVLNSLGYPWEQPDPFTKMISATAGNVIISRKNSSLFREVKNYLGITLSFRNPSTNPLSKVKSSHLHHGLRGQFKSRGQVSGAEGSMCPSPIPPVAF